MDQCPIEVILQMLDWHNTKEIQREGIRLASGIQELGVLIQPLYEQYNKNVWDNCAFVLASKDDLELEPYLTLLLEWLQDENWPGSKTIFNRLVEYRNRIALNASVSGSLEKAINDNDCEWRRNLLKLITQNTERNTESAGDSSLC